MLNASELVRKYAAFGGKAKVPAEHFTNEIAAVLPGVESDNGSFWLGRLGRVIDDLQPKGGKKAIDIGSGFGNHTARLRDRYETVYGLDLCPERVDYARAKQRRQGLCFMLFDASRPEVSLPLAGVDLVHTCVVLQHMNLEDRVNVFLTAHRHLREGGHLVMCEGRFTADNKPDELSARQTHMFATPMMLLHDIFGNITDHGEDVYSCRKEESCA